MLYLENSIFCTFWPLNFASKLWCDYYMRSERPTFHPFYGNCCKLVCHSRRWFIYFQSCPDSFMRGMCVKVRALGSQLVHVSSPCLGAEGRRPRTRALVRAALFIPAKGAQRKRGGVFRQPANSAAGEHWKEGLCLSLLRISSSGNEDLQMERANPKC